MALQSNDGTLKSAKIRLRNYLNQFVNITDKDWAIIEPFLKLYTAKKNYLITKENEIETELYFIINGTVRLFFEKDTNDITINIAFPNSFTSSYTSFLTQKPSTFNLQALTNIESIKINKKDLETIYTVTSSGQELGRIFSEQFFLYLSERETSFMLLTPTERYLNLFKHQPDLIKHIPLKYLASYIGITPQALSRIRAKIN